MQQYCLSILSNIVFTTVLFEHFVKHRVYNSTVWPLVTKHSVNTALWITMFDLNCLLQTSKRSHFDEGSFAVFVSRCAVKCSGCLMGQYTHRQFKLQFLNTPQPAWWSKLAQWLQYRWDLARASADQDPSNLSSKRTWCRQIWLRRSFRKILTHCF